MEKGDVGAETTDRSKSNSARPGDTNMNPWTGDVVDNVESLPPMGTEGFERKLTTKTNLNLHHQDKSLCLTQDEMNLIRVFERAMGSIAR